FACEVEVFRTSRCVVGVAVVQDSGNRVTRYPSGEIMKTVTPPRRVTRFGAVTAMFACCAFLAVPSTLAAKGDDPKSDAAAESKLLYTHTIKDYGAEWVSFNKDETRLFILTNELTPDGKSRRLVLTLDAATGKQLQSLGIPGLGSKGAISADGTRLV